MIKEKLLGAVVIFLALINTTLFLSPPNKAKAKKDKLLIEEYKVFPKDKIHDLDCFEPEDCLSKDILKKRAKWRNKKMEVELSPLGDDSKKIMIKSYLPKSTERSLIYKGYQEEEIFFEVYQESKLVYKFNSSYSPISIIQNFYVYDGHWILEYVRPKIKTQKMIGCYGNVVIDGVNLNKKLKSKEVFHYVFIKDQPFYFYIDRANKTRISYAGKTLPQRYDEVVHHGCCSISFFNPTLYHNMVTFYGLKNNFWYYVEAGIYSE